MIGLWLVVLLGCSNVGDDSFRQGLESLREGDSSKAVAALSDALDEGGRNAGVYHAMGNSLYRLDRKAEAAAAWRRCPVVEAEAGRRVCPLGARAPCVNHEAAHQGAAASS